MNKMITWFEIPSSDFGRAVQFYNTVLDRTLQVSEFMGIPHGFFGSDKQADGAVIASTGSTPGATGPLIYLRVGNLDDALERVAPAGGSVVVPKTSLGEQGEFAVILDTEGNRVGLHSLNGA